MNNFIKIFFFLFCTSGCVKKLKNNASHTYKLQQNLKIKFLDKDRLVINFDEQLYSSVSLKVYLKDEESKKRLLEEKTLETSETVHITINDEDAGFIAAVITATDSHGNSSSSSAVYNIEEQDDINKAKKKVLKKRN